MEVFQNDYTKKSRIKHKDGEIKSTNNSSFSFRESYESYFMYWRNSFIQEGRSNTHSSFQSTNSQRQRQKSI
jgi:hypothetical protein